jgi:hypothetical protein
MTHCNIYTVLLCLKYQSGSYYFEISFLWSVHETNTMNEEWEDFVLPFTVFIFRNTEQFSMTFSNQGLHHKLQDKYDSGSDWSTINVTLCETKHNDSQKNF